MYRPGAFRLSSASERGRDWDRGDEDGGPGKRGVVTKVAHEGKAQFYGTAQAGLRRSGWKRGSGTWEGAAERQTRELLLELPNGWVTVKWEGNGHENRYRWGADHGQFELELVFAALPPIAVGEYVFRLHTALESEKAYRLSSGPGATTPGHDDMGNRRSQEQGLVTRLVDATHIEVLWPSAAPERRVALWGDHGVFEVLLSRVNTGRSTELLYPHVAPLLIGTTVKRHPGGPKWATLGPGGLPPNEDGGPAGLGVVTDIALDGPHRGYVAVSWRRTGATELYRWGLGGSQYDLVAVAIPCSEGAYPTLPVGALVRRSADCPGAALYAAYNDHLGVVLGPEPGQRVGWVRVQWLGTRVLSDCRWGAQGAHDLDVISCHARDTQCDRCGLSIVFKRRLHWRCLDCERYDLCDECHSGLFSRRTALAESMFSGARHSYRHAAVCSVPTALESRDLDPLDATVAASLMGPQPPHAAASRVAPQLFASVPMSMPLTTLAAAPGFPDLYLSTAADITRDEVLEAEVAKVDAWRRRGLAQEDARSRAGVRVKQVAPHMLHRARVEAGERPGPGPWALLGLLLGGAAAAGAAYYHLSTQPGWGQSPPRVAAATPGGKKGKRGGKGGREHGGGGRCRCRRRRATGTAAPSSPSFPKGRAEPRDL